jgi:hypothetical protein
LSSTVLALLLAAPAAAGAGYFASGVGARVVGPDPYALARTRPVRGSVFVQDEDAATGGGHGMHVRLDVEFGDRTDRYRVRGRRLSTRWFSIDRRAVPRIGPRLIAWGWVEVSRNGSVVGSRVPVTITVLADPPVTGIGIEVATARRNLRGAEFGYLHLLWPDPVPLTVAPGADRPVTMNGN